MSELEKCPYCDARVPAGDLKAQQLHMEGSHPDVIARRLRDSGFRMVDGEWVDTQVGAD